MATKPSPTKTWSEIKLRDPDLQTRQQLELIMQDKFELSASKAITRYINEYSAIKASAADLRNTNMQLRDLLDAKEKELLLYRHKLKDIRELYRAFQNELNTEFSLGDKNPQQVIAD